MYDNVNINVSGPTLAAAKYKTVVLKDNQSFASQVTELNTKYVVKYDFNLGGETITIPAGCMLDFDGGSIFNGTVKGTNTVLNWNGGIIFGSGLHINSETGNSWICPTISTKMFSDLNYINSIRELQNLNSDNIQTTVIIEEASFVDLYNNHRYHVQMPNAYEGGFNIASNTNFIINGVIKADNSNVVSGVLKSYEKENIVIKGAGAILGDRDVHVGNTGEWGHCIFIDKCNNVKIEDLTIGLAWGDGIDIGLSGNCYNVLIKGVTISDCRRQGISLEGCENGVIENCKITDINGTAPADCICLEPVASQPTTAKFITIRDNILINERCIEFACAGRVGIIGDILIENNYLEGYIKGIWVDVSKNVRIKSNEILIKTTVGGSIPNPYKDFSIFCDTQSSAITEITNNTIYGTSYLEIESANIIGNKFINTTSNIQYTVEVIGGQYVRTKHELDNPIDVLSSFNFVGDKGSFVGNEFENTLSVFGKKSVISSNKIAMLISTNGNLVTDNIITKYADVGGVVSNNEFVFSPEKEGSIEGDYAPIALRGGVFKNNYIKVSSNEDNYFNMLMLTTDSTEVIDNHISFSDENPSAYCNGILVSFFTNSVFNNNYLSSPEIGSWGLLGGSITIANLKGLSGLSSAKPTVHASYIGYSYYETDNNRYVFWTGTEWVNAIGETI